MMDMYETDTIAAISTAPAAGGIGIVRLSGPEAIPVADSVFRPRSGTGLSYAATHTIHYGWILEETGQVLDEVLVSVMRSPSTYTREDVVEINCHGGVYVTRRVLSRVLQAGARLAGPGEFTKRAFLNGRIGLADAEAVMDLIAADNPLSLKNALAQLGGETQREIGSIRSKLLSECARIESALDDPEHFTIEPHDPLLLSAIAEAKERLTKLYKSADEGRIFKEGILTVILGSPNVGKSTLLNRIARTERAIVTDIPGTTRDILEESVVLNGVPLRLVDTAGLRETEDEIEKIGAQRALRSADMADLILYVIDGAQGVTERDADMLSSFEGKNVIVLINKADLPRRVTQNEITNLIDAPMITISARSGAGLDELADYIRDLFFEGDISFHNQVYITNERHKEAIAGALHSISLTENAVRSGLPEDLYTVDLMDAVALLGQITGEDAGEDLVNEIFENFCMGK